MKTTKRTARAEMKAIEARLSEIATAWQARGVTEAEQDERRALLDRRAALDTTPANPVDSSIR